MLQVLLMLQRQQHAADTNGMLLMCILPTGTGTAGLLRPLAGPSIGAASTAPTHLPGLSAVVPAAVGFMVQGSAAAGRKQTVLVSRVTKATATGAVGTSVTSKIPPPVVVTMLRPQQLLSTGQLLFLQLVETLRLGPMAAWAVWLVLCRAWQGPCKVAQQDITTQQQDGALAITGTITALPATISMAQALRLASQSRALPLLWQLLLAALRLQLPTTRLHLQVLLGLPWPLPQRLLLAQQRQLYRMRRCSLVAFKTEVCRQIVAAAQASTAAAAMAPAAAMGRE
jgi:hypothetical protein